MQNKIVMAFSISALLLITGLLPGQVSEEAAVTEVTVDDYEPRTFTSSQGDTIQYRLFIPRDYDADKTYPLVLFHHGAGGSGNDNRRNLEGPCPMEWAGPERQAANPCFIVAPQIPRNRERDRDRERNRENPVSRTERMRKHIQTIHEILDSLEKEFSIDTGREYVTGLSMGGECTWMSLIERPDRFAAGVPICAGDRFIGMEPSEMGRKFAQLPIWIFHGDADDVISVEVSRTLVEALRDAGGNPLYTEYPGVGHDSWELAYRSTEFIDWFFAQSRKPVSNNGGQGGQTISRTITHDGIERSYILYVPARYSGNSAVPLVFNFHGAGGTAKEQMEYGDFRPVANAEGFIVVHPQGQIDEEGETSFNADNPNNNIDDVDFTDALIKDISATYNIDLKQVYAAGMSNGGFMTFTLACALNDKIAAIASVSGTMTSYRMDNCSPEYPIPVLLIHGTSDGAIPYKGGNSFDGDAFFTSVDQVMDFWVRHNQCDPEPAITKLADTNPSDGSYIEHYVYSGGTNQITTELFKVVRRKKKKKRKKRVKRTGTSMRLQKSGSSFLNMILMV
ncbi:MAG: alpha/beta hydrolase-fold protein [Planctomycetota bacterium]|jgi:predicted peptidase